jgi:predicted nucleotidyltransferase
MTTKSDLIVKLRELKTSIQQRYPVKALALFGSYSRETHTSLSDVDILVELNGKIGSRFIDLADEMENALGLKVDLVSRNGIKPKYFAAIKSELIYV